MNRSRPFTPKKIKEKNPLGPRNPNSKVSKKERNYKPDQWDGGGGVVYHAKGEEINYEEMTKQRNIEQLRRDCSRPSKDKIIRDAFKSFIPPKQIVKPVVVEKVVAPPDLGQSTAFDAKRLRNIGFDPRIKVNEEARYPERKISPIVGRIMDNVLGGFEKNSKNDGETDSDSDSDLDIIMVGGETSLL